MTVESKFHMFLNDSQSLEGPGLGTALSVYQTESGSRICKGPSSSVGLHGGTSENVRGIILCSKNTV